MTMEPTSMAERPSAASGQTHERSEARPAPSAIPFGNPDELLAQTPRHTDVIIGGKKYRVRELRQEEAEEVAHASLKASTGLDGKDIIKADFRGRAARAIAYAWIHQDGRQVFANPAEDYKKVNGSLSPSVVRALFKAVDELSAITEAEKDELGKDSGPTGDDAG